MDSEYILMDIIREEVITENKYDNKNKEISKEEIKEESKEVTNILIEEIETKVDSVGIDVRTDKKTDKKTDIDIENINGNIKKLMIHSDIDNTTVENVTKFLISLVKDDLIDLYITTSGGDAIHTFTIVSMLKMYADRLAIYVYDKAYSAGSMIVILSCPKRGIYMSNIATLSAFDSQTHMDDETVTVDMDIDKVFIGVNDVKYKTKLLMSYQYSVKTRNSINEYIETSIYSDEVKDKIKILFNINSLKMHGHKYNRNDLLNIGIDVKECIIDKKKYDELRYDSKSVYFSKNLWKLL